MNPRDVVLGMGNNVDYELRWDEDEFRRRVARVGLTRADLGQQVIVDERSLLASMCAFMDASVGGEREVGSPTVIEEFIEGFEWRATMGGTAMRAAAAMSRLGVGGTLHLTTMNECVRRSLPAGFDWVCSAAQERLYPHLIVQYPAGASIELADGYQVAPRMANRLIYVRDDDNARLLVSPRFAAMMPAARFVLVSGFNAITDPNVLARRLDQVGAALDGVGVGATVMLEEAAYHDPAFAVVVASALGSRAGVHSMNADEFAGWAGRDQLPSDPGELAGEVARLRKRIGADNLLVHAQEWALVCGPQAEAFGPALEHGVRVAATRVRVGDALTWDELQATESFPRAAAGLALAVWAADHREAGVHVCPGYVVDVPRPVTIGLGDAFVGGFAAALTRR